jgi:hypothetical protein
VVQRAREKVPWIKLLERDQICNLFWERGVLGQLMPYEPTGTLGFWWFCLVQKIWPINRLVNARWLRPWRRWLRPWRLELGPWRLGLGVMTSWILVMTSWTKQGGRGRESRQIPRQNVRWRDRITIFELTFSIKRPSLQRRGWGWPQGIKGLPFSFLHATTPSSCYYLPIFCYSIIMLENPPMIKYSYTI